MMKKPIALVMCLLLLALPLVSQAATFDTSHATAYTYSRFSCGCTMGGSGAMVGRYGFLTAAHNLYCHLHGQPLKTCDFYFGAKSVNSCWYKYDGKFTYWAYDTFRNGYDSANDIGFVIFETPVGDETGWFGTWAGTDSEMDQEFTHVLSHDANRHLQSLFEVQYVYDANQLYWKGLINGTSGGPVYLWEEGYDYPWVVGVYTSYDENGNSYARRLTLDVFEDMKANGAFR